MAMDDYRDRGRYRHSYHESEMNTPRYNEPCRYFMKGNCARGKDCFYQHGSASIQYPPRRALPPPRGPHGPMHPGHMMPYRGPPHPHHPHPGHPPQYGQYQPYGPAHPHPAAHGHVAAPPAPYDPYSAGYPPAAPTAAGTGSYPQSYYQYYGAAAPASAATAPPGYGVPAAAPKAITAAAPTSAATAAAGNAAAYYQQYGYGYQPQYAHAAATASYPQQQGQQVPPPQGKGPVPTGKTSEEQKTNPSNVATAATAAPSAVVGAKAVGTMQSGVQMRPPQGGVMAGSMQQQSTAAWYPPVAAPTGMQPMYANPGYGASRQQATAATNARWDPYSLVMPFCLLIFVLVVNEWFMWCTVYRGSNGGASGDSSVNGLCSLCFGRQLLMLTWSVMNCI